MPLRPFQVELHMDHKALSLLLAFLVDVVLLASFCTVSLINFTHLLAVEVWSLSCWEKWLFPGFIFLCKRDAVLFARKERYIIRKACVFFS